MHKSIIALLLLSRAVAFANEAADDQSNRVAFAGERTRAEVMAGVEQARAAGTLAIDEHAGNLPQAAQGSRSRGEVRAEAVQAARTRIVHEQM